MDALDLNYGISDSLIISSPIGNLLGKATKAGVCSLQFIDSAKPELNESLKNPELIFETKNNKHLKKLQSQMAEYFCGERKKFECAIDLRGSQFQQKVWNELIKIGYASTRTYKEQSLAMGNLLAIRAVAAANGANPIAIVIPCHRIVGTDGSLTGYAGGLWRKKWLLDFEFNNVSNSKQLSLVI